MMHRSFYERYYLWIILAFLAIIPLLVDGMIRSHKSNNNSVRQWLPEDLPATKDYNYFFEHFGTDEFAMVSWEGCTLDDARLTKFVDLLESYRDEDGDKIFGEVTSGPRLIEKLTGKPFDLKYREAVERLKGVVMGRDGEMTCAIVKLTKKGDASRRRSVETMRELAANDVGIAPEELHMAGDAVTNAEVDIASQNAIGSLVHWAMIIAVTIAYVSLRSVRLVIIVFFVAVYSSVFAECLVPWLGGSMNLVLVVMPVLIYVLALSAGVHVVNYYQDAVEETGLDGAPLVALEHGWLPCTLASGTTAIGLASLCVSHIAPVKDFGTYSALGIIASLAILFLMLPAFLVAKQKLDFWFKSRRPVEKQRSPAAGHPFDPVITFFGSIVVRRHVIMAIICTVMLGFFGWGTFSINTSVKPKRFFRSDSRLISDYNWLAEEQRFGPQIPIELVVQFSGADSSLDTFEQLQLIRDLQDYLAEGTSHVIGSTMSAVTFAPELDATGIRRLTTRRRLDENRGDYRQVSFYSNYVTGKLPRFAGLPNDADGESPQSDGAFAAGTVLAEFKYPEGTSDYMLVKSAAGQQGLVRSSDLQKQSHHLWRISARIQKSELDYDVVVKNVQKDVTDFLDARRNAREQDAKSLEDKYQQYLDQAQAEFSRQQQELKDAPQAWADFEQSYEAKLYNAEKKYNVQLAKLSDDTQGLTILYTGMVPLFHEAQNELLDGLFNSFLLAFVLIAVLMIFWFRSAAAGLVTMLPNVFPAAVIFGWMGWTGRIVDIGSMMTASVAMGIAVDDTVHFLTWFRRGLQEGMTRRDAIMHGYRRCAVAMAQTTMIAGFGLLVFVASSFQPVSQFGLLMFVLLVAALVGDLIYLPALLAGRFGKLFEPKPQPQAPAEVSEPVASQS